MTRVIILGKTKIDKGWKRCIGAVGIYDHRSYRLLTEDRKNFPQDTKFEIGDIWDLELRHVSDIEPPHTEDHLVLRAEKVPSTPFPAYLYIIKEIGAPVIFPKQLFDGKLKFAQNNKAYIWPGNKGLDYSTGFWRFSKDLHLCHDKYGKARYAYCDNDISCDLENEDLKLDVAYVGCEEAIDRIPAGSLLRFSLARWEGKPCYLMLSGWFLAGDLAGSKKNRVE